MKEASEIAMTVIDKDDSKFLIKPVKAGYKVKEYYKDYFTKEYVAVRTWITRNLDFLESFT